MARRRKRKTTVVEAVLDTPSNTPDAPERDTPSSPEVEKRLTFGAKDHHVRIARNQPARVTLTLRSNWATTAKLSVQGGPVGTVNPASVTLEPGRPATVVVGLVCPQTVSGDRAGAVVATADGETARWPFSLDVL
jgi:hypothetical protein